MKRLLFVVPLFVVATGLALYATREPAQVVVQDVSGVRRLVAAAPFETAKPWTHLWQVEQPLVSRGWLCVVEADPALCAPKQTAEAVLVAGARIVERVNHGSLGRTIVLVPEVDGAGVEALAEWWWAPPALPEQLDQAAVAAARAKLPAGGVHRVTAEELAAALAAGGGAIAVADESELHRVAAAWILEHAPEDHETAQGLLVPGPR